METLKEYIVYLLRKNKTITVHDFMDLCLSHPSFGYYKNISDIGKGGDFITAPEISQVFGEILACFSAHLFPHAPIVEYGPGRGTLAYDILKTMKKINNSHLYYGIDINPSFLQQQIKKGIQPINTIDAIKEPIVILCNEFLDALPVEQWIVHKETHQKRQRNIVLQEKNKCVFEPINDDEYIHEVNPKAQQYVKEWCQHIAQYGGMIILIDYGYIDGFGNTIQSLMNHHYIHPCEQPGLSDVTAHVDFGALHKIATSFRLKCHIDTQRSFLLSMGIKERINNLIEYHQEEKATYQQALHRLTHPEEMGQLFKVMTIQSH